jgi:hypothetical protein
VLLLLAPRVVIVLVAALTVGTLGAVLFSCTTSSAPSPVGKWRSSEYPSIPPNPDYFLEIKANGEYSYSDVPGHGTWSLRGDQLVLNAFPGAKREELTVESEYKKLNNKYVDAVGFVPVDENQKKR